MRPRDLIKTCRDLLSLSSGKPAEASLRRATSTAYYAVFHCLAWNCADLIIGTSGAKRSEEAWQQVYRSLEHSYAKTQCLKKTVMKRFPADIQDFANVFVALQEKRLDADYHPRKKFLKSEVIADVDSAETAIDTFNKAPIEDRRAFCVWVLLRTRSA